MIEEIPSTIVHLDQNRNLLRKKGLAAAQRIATRFSAENYRATVNSVYQATLCRQTPD
jgi:hypothetical protein